MAASVLNLALACPKCKAPAGERCVNLRDGGIKTASHVSRTPKQPCGTYGAYQQHRKDGEDPCDACREASRRYMAEYRKKNPEYRNADILLLRARNRAMSLLAKRHQSELRALIDQCLVEGESA